MGLTHYPNGVSSFGMPVLGGGKHMTTGNVFFVDSGSAAGADNAAKGSSPDTPFASIDFAIGRCTANNGDVIIAMPGHTETVSAAAGLDFDVAGISLIGLGRGSDRPTVSIGTATTADVDIDAANVYIENILFTGDVDALVAPIDINAADCTLIDIETRDVTGQAVDWILTDANADRLYISGWTHRGAAAAGGASAISIVGGDNITIENFWIDGNFSAAAIENVTTAAVNLTVGGGYKANYARTRNAADVIFTAVATTTGNVGPNIYARLQDDAANITEAFVGADMQFFQPVAIVNADGQSSLNTNITASTDA